MRPVALLVRLEIAGAGDEIGHHLRLLELALHLDTLLVGAGVAAEREERVGRERDVAGQRRATCDVRDVRGQPAVFVHDENARQPAAGVGRPHEIRARLAIALGRRIFDVLGLDAANPSAGSESALPRTSGRAPRGSPPPSCHPPRTWRCHPGSRADRSGRGRTYRRASRLQDAVLSCSLHSSATSRGPGGAGEDITTNRRIVSRESLKG